ncbi:hypothetical protein HDU91_001393 [Kappamyces sp. JEL0680]|nr:hypothetical protein HDU91_001393 [Kappamyces sp. JEL0680]
MELRYRTWKLKKSTRRVKTIAKKLAKKLKRAILWSRSNDGSSRKNYNDGPSRKNYNDGPSRKNYNDYVPEKYSGDSGRKPSRKAEYERSDSDRPDAYRDPPRYSEKRQYNEGRDQYDFEANDAEAAFDEAPAEAAYEPTASEQFEAPAQDDSAFDQFSDIDAEFEHPDLAEFDGANFDETVESESNFDEDSTVEAESAFDEDGTVEAESTFEPESDEAESTFELESDMEAFSFEPESSDEVSFQDQDQDDDQSFVGSQESSLYKRDAPSSPQVCEKPGSFCYNAWKRLQEFGSKVKAKRQELQRNSGKMKNKQKKRAEKALKKMEENLKRATDKFNKFFQAGVRAGKAGKAAVSRKLSSAKSGNKASVNGTARIRIGFKPFTKCRSKLKKGDTLTLFLRKAKYGKGMYRLYTSDKSCAAAQPDDLGTQTTVLTTLAKAGKPTYPQGPQCLQFPSGAPAATTASKLATNQPGLKKSSAERYSAGLGLVLAVMLLL